MIGAKLRETIKAALAYAKAIIRTEAA